MREIKFRAWDKRKNIMIDNVQKGTYNDNFHEFLHYDCFEVMQYTGLKDKNGVEVYEGDVVKNDHVEDNIGKVIWSQAGGSYRIKYRHWTGPVSTQSLIHCEVIGNIYENPELLEQ